MGPSFDPVARSCGTGTLKRLSFCCFIMLQECEFEFIDVDSANWIKANSLFRLFRIEASRRYGIGVSSVF